MKKWETLTESDIEIEIENEEGNHSTFDLMDFGDLLEDIDMDSVKLLNVTNIANQEFPKSLQTLIDLYIDKNDADALYDLLSSFVDADLYDSDVVDDSQVLFVEYLNLTNKDYEEALDMFESEVSDSMMHTEKQLTDKREIIETIIKMLHRNKSYDDIIILNAGFIDEKEIKHNIIQTLKDNGDYEEVTENDIDELVDKELSYLRYENPEELITYIDVDKAYKYISEYYTIIVDDNGTCIIDKYM
nr:MAG TPA: hypothetical protein [Caudoviricetes sp.]